MLRAVAAIGVIFTHAITRINTTIPDGSDSSLFILRGDQWRAGDSGVDLFFVISGFIMMYVHRDDFGRAGASRRFITRRFQRIVPPYWIMTTVGLAIMIVMPSLFTTHSGVINIPWIIGSYLFLPIPSPDGNISPIVGVGWTLVYEMFFYALFALVIALPLRTAIHLIFFALIALVVLGVMWPHEGPVFAFMTSWLLLDFLLGIGIAWLVLARGAPASPIRRAALLIGVAVLASTIVWTPPEQGYLRFLLWGIPSALILLSACGAEAPKGWFGRMSSILGDASYSIYLFQFLALPFWARAMRAAGFGALPFDARILVLTAAVTISGVAFWYLIERPSVRATKMLLLRA